MIEKLQKELQEKIEQHYIMKKHNKEVTKEYYKNLFKKTQFIENSRAIRSLRERIKVLEEEKKHPVRILCSDDEFRVVDNPVDKKVEVYFSDGPSDDLKEKLAVNGFRWNEVKKCWQRMRSNYALELVHEVMLFI